MSEVYFISGIDTNIGKSYATGLLAAKWAKLGKKVITQKIVQTGGNDFSDDIVLHRKIMKTGLLPEDRNRLTMPEIFTYPASPHLAAEIDKRAIDFVKIEKATQALCNSYDIVLLEGAGGLMAPLTRNLLTIDYITDRQYPLILVTSGRLGSINHTLLSFEAIEHRNIQLHTVVYNLFDENPDHIISNDTFQYIYKQIGKRFPDTQLITLPIIDA